MKSTFSKFLLVSVMLGLSGSVISINAFSTEPAKTFTAQMKSKYTLSEISDILKKEGYSVEPIKGEVLSFKIEGDKFIAVTYNNGDIQFSSLYGSSDSFSLRKLNKLNSDSRVGKYILNDDGGIRIEVTIRSNNKGLTIAQIIQGAKDIKLLDRYAINEFSDK
ncbi:TPA: YbjN domain-containing protein [Haemophilus influenzae]|uniref:YbjN domain-containing protein n=2 Tax=Haemophilus influenzae TaxID=727 RepID=UPI000D40F2DF|nr:YbjN domain-containing protein [Haemophilus influenzae]PRI39775.1 hypothetical protein BVZ56_01333 [Haemophilus influenzae]PRI47642.1 hypothetical protein BVZ70_01202 [Haemophilus influenzae]PRJ56577.1 hypothetical protein BV094_00121 [Haemophilus influenzae]PRJ57839.1 hypothetical protein BV097_01380 [Haemophilus influenzae]PRK15353.1 hypothetical protein BV195_01312 [Haemophilus influenzae]